MKCIILLSIAALGATAVFGQETETPTSASSPTESSSAEASESPTAKSSSTSKQYPTPGVTATPAASAAKSTSTPAPKTTPAAGPIVPKGTAEQQIRQIEDTYPAATMSHNVALVEPFLADDLAFTDSKGRLMSKRATIAEMKKDTDTYTTAKNTELKLHPVDHDVYLVTGVYHEAGKDKSGQAFDRRYRFTDTLVNRGGKWLVVASHVSTLSAR